MVPRPRGHGAVLLLCVWFWWKLEAVPSTLTTHRGQLDAFLCEGPGGEWEKHPSLKSSRGFAGSSVYGHTDVSIHSVLPKRTEWESNTVAGGRFTVAKDKRLTLKHKMK